MAEKRQTYTAEFKREAVRLVTEQRYGVAETARNLGINVNMLRRWKQEHTVNTSAAFPGNGRLTPEQAELRQLRDEVKRLRMERDILKNCVVAFARHVWVEKLPPVGYRRSYGRSDRRPFGGADPVKKHGPGNCADVRVVTPCGDPV
jgi:transposase